MKLHHLAVAVAVTSMLISGCNKDESTTELKTPAQKVSYGIGYSMGKNFKEDGIDDLSPQAIAAGVADALAEKEQRVDDETLMEAFGFMQERAQERMNAVNDEAAKAGKAFLAENAKREGVITTETGLQYEVLTAGTGAQPKINNVVSVHYHGTLIDGSVFDSSVERGTPAEFPVGAVIPGWVEGLQLMHVGEKVKFYIPSELAYGTKSPAPAIPANSALIFEVELLAIAGQDLVEPEDEIEDDADESVDAVEDSE